MGILVVLIEETIKQFGYDPRDLSKGSRKKVVVKCDYCGNNTTKKLSVSSIGISQNKKTVSDDCCMNKNCLISKRKKVFNIKFGKNWPIQLDYFKKKRIQTNMDRYGVENPSSLPFVRKKVIATVKKKYGVENVFQHPDIIEKARKSYVKNGNVPTSSQQIKIYEMLKKNNFDVILNKPVSSLIIDIYLKYEGYDIALEYDGGGHFVWRPAHVIQQNDIKRDKVLQSKGYKVFRIESRKDKLPTLEQIQEGLTKLTTGDRKFLRIKLS